MTLPIAWTGSITSALFVGIRTECVLLLLAPSPPPGGCVEEHSISWPREELSMRRDLMPPASLLPAATELGYADPQYYRRLRTLLVVYA